MGQNTGLTVTQAQALAGLLKGKTAEKVAAEIGVGRSTVYRWLSEPDFQSVYYESRMGIVQEATVAMQLAMSDAVGVLRTMMRDKKVPAMVRFKAAEKIYESGARWGETEYIAQLTLRERHASGMEWEKAGFDNETEDSDETDSGATGDVRESDSD